jgi:FdhD protein
VQGYSYAVYARTRDPALLPGAATRLVQRRTPAGIQSAEDIVACEVPIALHVNAAPFAVLMATPCDLADLTLGFALSERIIGEASELRIDRIEESLDGIAVHVSVPNVREDELLQRTRNLPGYGGCGVCGSASIDGVLRVPAQVPSVQCIDEAALHCALDALYQQQPLNAETGATHAAAFANRHGALQLVREDVGRHNALDKLIGAMSFAGIDSAAGFAITTSRASYELAMKAAQVGIPLLAAISAPTTLAIALAQSTGLGLVGFARDGQCVVYAHPQRLQRTP